MYTQEQRNKKRSLFNNIWWNFKGGNKDLFCTTHPDNKALAICQKLNIGQCKECIVCKDPQSYCKFRSQCIAWELEKEKKALGKER